MRFIDFFWEHPALVPFTKAAKAGEILFHQGEPSDSVLIVCRGIGELTRDTSGNPLVVSQVDAGNFLGEQILVGGVEHPRRLGLVAKTEMTFIRFSKNDWETLRQEYPELAFDIMRGALAINLYRVTRSNDIVRILRSNSNAERFAHLILFLAENEGIETPNGYEIDLRDEVVHYYMNILALEKEAYVSELTKEKYLERVSDDRYVLRNARGLLAKIPSFIETNLIPAI